MPGSGSRTGGHGMPPKMRTITFVDRLTFEFKGNVAQNAVCLADVDNDGEFELVIGNSSGELVIFKGAGTKPWRVSSGKLGHIMAICAGDLFNLGANVLVVISADGFVNLFDCSSIAGANQLITAGTKSPAATSTIDTDDKVTPNAQTSSVSSTNTSTPSTPAVLATTPQASAGASPQLAGTPSDSALSEGVGSGILGITPIFQQRIPANVKDAMIGDANGDGFNELIVTLTDRVVRTYRWHHTGDFISMEPHGHLIPRNKWEFASQVGSTTLHRDHRNRPILLISQPGGSFLKVRVPEGRPTAVFDDPIDDDEDDETCRIIRSFEPLVISNIRNCYVTTEILGEFSVGASSSSTDEDQKAPDLPFAMATLDGNLIFGKDEDVLWSMQVNHQLFCLNKMDLDEDGKDEIVVGSWDGHTYIVTQDCRAVEFVFEESLLAFTCGKYTVEDETVPVLVYVTCTGKIFIYYNISLPKDVEMKTLPENMMLNKTVPVTPELTRFLLYAPFRRKKSVQH